MGGKSNYASLAVFIFFKLQIEGNSHDALESWVYNISAVWYLPTQFSFSTKSEKYLGGGDALLFPKFVCTKIKAGNSSL